MSDGQNRQIYWDAKVTGCQPRSGLEAAKKDFLIDMGFFQFSSVQSLSRVRLFETP